ncbi:GIDE domain-containing protein [Marinactinospora thermotolerans]|uniref:RING-type E3 ubiquitin transferase n=1 Tax=Marinactinospora thermotolerans DSM 45154 TaxID=1122192 RepID=A0A1T4N0C2_9ACTN|nr:GIDE domain-containing protein [Marinactinospora thermotolerans]SJZ72749.1 E3 Ubiquitin ligase [Marinactinospora thermotolerans DSM 45154]
MLVIGTALLIGAAILAPPAFLALRRWLGQRALAEVRPRALAARAGRDVAIPGRAVPGPDGLVESRLARVDCVWHGHEVLRHYWTWRSPERGEGERERVRGCDPIAEYGSPELFGLAAPNGDGPPRAGVLVDPGDAEVVGVDMCLQRLVGRPQRGVPAPADDLLGRIKGRVSGIFRGETIEFEYREWVIRPGDPVVVRGRVVLRDGRPVIVAPPDGRLRIEWGAAEEAGPQARGAGALLLGGGTVASAFVGLALVLAGV